MGDQTELREQPEVLYIIARTYVLSGLFVVGMFIALSNSPCDVKLVGEFVGLSSGAVLLVQCAVAQFAKVYHHQVAAHREQA